MNLFSIAWKSIRQRALASSLTGLSVALGVMLMVCVLVIFGIVERAFSQQSIAYHLIVGPKGSDLQLVLSSVYRISPPIENLPYKFYEEVKARPDVEEAIPICLGDVTQKGSFPIVGTVPDYFALPYAPGKTFRIRGPFTKEIKTYDAVIGAEVARTNDWDVGSTFKLVHGGAESDHVHDEIFTVQGVMAPTGTPNDKTVFVTLNGFYSVAGHDTPLLEALRKDRTWFGPNEDNARLEELEAKAERGETIPQPHFHGDQPDYLKEVTAIFVRMKSIEGAEGIEAMSAIRFASQLKDDVRAQAVNPVQVMQRLMDNFVGNVEVVLLVLTGLVIAVSGVGIFVSIYNSMADRRKEIAIMRALGARRQTVFAIILAEAVLLCVGGGLLGVALGHGLVFFAAPIVEARSGILIDPLAFEQVELILLPALVTLAALIGVVPALTAYRTDVARALAE